MCLLNVALGLAPAESPESVYWSHSPKTQPRKVCIRTTKSLHLIYKNFVSDLQTVCIWPTNSVHHPTKKMCAFTISTAFHSLGLMMEGFWAAMSPTKWPPEPPDTQNDLQAPAKPSLCLSFHLQASALKLHAPRFDLCLPYLYVIYLLWLNLPKFKIYLFIVESTIN